MTDEVRIQAEVGGAARIDPGNGVQRPGYMIRDFTLNSSSGEEVRISSFRGSDNLVLVFPGHSKAMRAFLEDAATHSRDLANQQAAVIAVLPDDGKEHAVPNQGASQILELYDETLSVHRRSGAVDEDGRLVPVIYVTDRFGEIVATHLVEGASRRRASRRSCVRWSLLIINVLSANPRNGLARAGSSEASG